MHLNQNVSEIRSIELDVFEMFQFEPAHAHVCKVDLLGNMAYHLILAGEFVMCLYDIQYYSIAIYKRADFVPQLNV